MEVIDASLYDYPKYYELLFGSDWKAEFDFLEACFDRRRRRERLGMTVDVYTPTRRFRLAEEMVFRTYTARQFARLLGRLPQFEPVATYDFAYKVDRPIQVDGRVEDVVYVLRKR